MIQEKYCSNNSSNSWQHDISAHLNAKFGVEPLFTPGAAPVKAADENRKNRIEKRRTQRIKLQGSSPAPAPAPPPDTEFDTTEVKRQERLMRNRAAAQKSRDNKKQKLNLLEAEMEQMSNENFNLKQRIAYLESLVQTLSTAPPAATASSELSIDFEECHAEFDLTPSGTPGEMVTLSLDSSSECNECNADGLSAIASPEAIAESPSVSSPEAVMAEFGPFGEISDFLIQDEENQPLQQDEFQYQTLQSQSRRYQQKSQKLQHLQQSQEQQQLHNLQNGSISQFKSSRNSIRKQRVSSSKSAVLDSLTSLPLEGTQCQPTAVSAQLQVALTLLCLASSLSTTIQKSYVKTFTEALENNESSSQSSPSPSFEESSPSTTSIVVGSTSSVIPGSLRKARWKQAEQGQCGVTLSEAFHPTQVTSTLLETVC